ncbi:MAG: DUF3343 domain-containing protein [Syntrophotaleaceae bacterium]
MVNEGEFVALFHSIHRVLKAEKLLKQESLKFLLIPAPRELSSACGLAIRFDAENRPQIEAILERESLLPGEIFIKTSDGYRLVNQA